MRPRVLPLISEAHARHLGEHMRDSDRIEISATWPTDDAVAWAVGSARVSTQAWTVLGDEVPIAIGGFLTPWPGVAFSWMVATGDIDEVASIVHHTAIGAHRTMESFGVHRFTCMSLADHRVAHAWLLRLGYRIEAAFERYGKRGETFIAFGRV